MTVSLRNAAFTDPSKAREQAKLDCAVVGRIVGLTSDQQIDAIVKTSRAGAVLSAEQLLAHGYDVLVLAPWNVELRDNSPPAGKSPAVFSQGLWWRAKGWTIKSCDRDSVLEWVRHSNSGIPNFGIRCASSVERAGESLTVVGIDIDTDDAEIISKLRALIPGAYRVGKRGMVLPVLVRGEVQSKDYKSAARGSVQVLAAGRQFVAHGVHPDTQEPYRWFNDQGERLAVMPAVSKLRIVDASAITTLLSAEGFNAGAGAKEAVAEKDVAPIVKHLAETDWPEYDDVYGSLDEPYNLQGLLARDAEFCELMESPVESCSDNRFKAARYLLREWKSLKIEELAAFFMQHDFCGEFVEGEGPGLHQFDMRQVAREWFKNAKPDNHKLTDGTAFGVVEDDDDLAESLAGGQPSETKIAKYIAGMQFGFDRHAGWQPMEWAIDRILPAVGVGLLWGDGNTGKSFLAFDWLDHVKRGNFWHGRRTLQGGALYIAGEGLAGLDSRIRALYDHRPASSRGDTFALRGDLPVFGKDARINAKKVELMIRAYAQVTGETVRLVVLDNLALMEGDVDENSSGPMTAILRELGELAHRMQLVVCVLHHSTKSGQTHRGSTGIRNVVDFSLRLDELENGVRTLMAEKMRDGAKGVASYFELLELRLGENQYGDAATSCVVVQATAQDAKRRTGAVSGSGPDAAMYAADDEAMTVFAMSDRQEDREAFVLAYLDRMASEQKASDMPMSEARRIVEIGTADVLEAVNKERKGANQSELSRALMSALLVKMSRDGKLQTNGKRSVAVRYRHVTVVEGQLAVT